MSTCCGEYAENLGERHRVIYETRLRAVTADPARTDFGERKVLGPLDDVTSVRVLSWSRGQ